MSTPVGPLSPDFMKQFQGQANSLIANPGGFSVNGRSAQIQDASPVYLGGGSYQGSTFTKTYVPYGEARMAPLSWSDQEMRRFVNKGIVNKVPGFGQNMGLPEIMAAWDDMVQSSYAFNQSGDKNKEWTPYDILNTYANNDGKFGTRREGDWVYDIATGERIKYVGPRSKTVTSKRVNLSSPGDVKALTTQMLRELLGRAPNAEELSQFRASINAEESANPEVTTTTQTLSPDLASGRVDVTAESSKTSGGFSADAASSLVQDETVDTKEYGKFQSGTTYFNALMQMISGG